MKKARQLVTHIDSTNLAADTVYYPSTSGMPMSGVEDITIAFATSGGVTTTIEALVNTSWVDITKSFTLLSTGVVGSASFIDTTDIIKQIGINVRSLRIKSVTSDATNAVRYSTIIQGGQFIDN